MQLGQLPEMKSVKSDAPWMTGEEFLAAVKRIQDFGQHVNVVEVCEGKYRIISTTKPNAESREDDAAKLAP